MSALFQKEWRENRLLLLSFLVLAPVLAALPVRPATVWAAKVLFLFGTAAVYAGLVTAMEAAAFGVAPGGALATPLLLVAGAGCAATFFSALDILTLSEIDLEAGRTVAERWVPPEVARELEDRTWRLRDGFPLREDDEELRGWWPRTVTGPDSFFVRRKSERALYLRSRRELVPLDLPERGWTLGGGLVPEGGAGSAFLVTRRGPVCALHLVPLDGGPRVELLRGQFQGWVTSPDRRKAVLSAAGEAWLLDGDRAALTKLPVEVGRCYRVRTLWDRDSSRFLIGTRFDTRLVTVADGEPAVTPLDLPWRWGEVHHDLAGDRFIVTRRSRGGDVLGSVTLDGKVTRLLPREEQ